MQYQSSRGQCSSVSAAEAITMGMAPDGGLFIPDYIPSITAEEMQAMQKISYQERACRILGYYLKEFSPGDIEAIIYGAYNPESFDTLEIAPLISIDQGLYIQELWHGPTSAFKDMALQVLPRLLTTSAQKIGQSQEIIILVATSGDTGKAALEGFKDVSGTRIIVFFPEEGVSAVQKRQMVTQAGSNVAVAGIEGNFDDAQNAVKAIFADQNFIQMLAGNNMKMSSANSINWGRLLPQIVYYISAYLDLVAGGKLKSGETINVVVPTGNFGNILAAFYSARMGVPINRLICASNANYVLTDFIRKGIYDRNRPFVKTISPSMDILISSNLERLLYELTGHDADRISNWMKELNTNGRYEIDQDIKEAIQELFWADYASDAQTIETISSVWKTKGYLLDTHTAVAMKVYQKYRQETGDHTTTLIASTASPFKFARSVAEAIMEPEIIAGKDEFAILNVLSEYTGLPIPTNIKDIDQRPILHRTVTSKAEINKTVLEILGLN